MAELRGTALNDRLKAAADAKKALIEKMRPKPAVTDPNIGDKAAAKKAELAQVRADREAAKVARKLAAADAEAAALQAHEDAEAAALDSKRGERKERKALTKSEAKAKRDAKYAARKARQ